MEFCSADESPIGSWLDRLVLSDSEMSLEGSKDLESKDKSTESRPLGCVFGDISFLNIHFLCCLLLPSLL